VILATTLETNRDEGYDTVSKAPKPTERYRQFADLDYPRKVVTVEPIMDFDIEIFAVWLIELKPEYIYLGFNSKPKEVKLTEPSEEKVAELMKILAESMDIRGKDLRSLGESNEVQKIR
jgi:hypothetical protein